MKTRQHLRVPLPMPVKVKILDQDEEFNLSRIDDISWGGAFVVIEPLPPVGSRIILQFSGENVALELWGSIVRVKEPAVGVAGGVGIQFDPLDDETRSLIQRLIDDEIRQVFKSL